MRQFRNFLNRRRKDGRPTHGPARPYEIKCGEYGRFTGWIVTHPTHKELELSLEAQHQLNRENLLHAELYNELSFLRS